jgi:hypothetical protein
MAKMKGITSKIVPAVSIGAGAVASGFVVSKLPIENEKLKAAVPVALGIFLMSRKGIIADLGAGMVAGGFLKLAQSFGIGEVDQPVMAIDEVDDLDIDGIDDEVVSGMDSEEDELES